EALTYFKALGIQIGSYYGRTRPFGQRSQNDPNGSLPDNQHRFITLQLKRFNRFQARIHRLDKCSLLVRNMVRNFNYAFTYDPIHHADVLGKTAAAGLKTRRGADLFVDQTLR